MEVFVKQLSIFVENKPGRLAEVSRRVSEAGVNMLALSVADTTDFGILRLIVDDSEKAASALRSCGYVVKTTDVAAIALEQRTGSLAEVLGELSRTDVSIEYLYAFTNNSQQMGAVVVIRFANHEATLEKLKDSGVRFLHEEDMAGF